MSAENGTPRAREIFHTTLIVGVLCPSSIWPSIARLTPEALARRSSDKPRRTRRRRRLAPRIGVRSAASAPSGAETPALEMARCDGSLLMAIQLTGHIDV